MSKSESMILHTIMDDLKNGYSFGRDMENVTYPYFHAQLYIYQNNGRKWIGWTHYGSSANSCTLKDLLWIITVIFDCKPSEFMNTYIRNDMSKYN